MGKHLGTHTDKLMNKLFSYLLFIITLLLIVFLYVEIWKAIILPLLLESKNDIYIFILLVFVIVFWLAITISISYFWFEFLPKLEKRYSFKFDVKLYNLVIVLFLSFFVALSITVNRIFTSEHNEDILAILNGLTNYNIIGIMTLAISSRCLNYFENKRKS